MAISNDPHYIVLLGDVGTGKSTIVEKLTGKRGRSSNASESCTRTSEPFHVPNQPLIVSDTPGSNSRKDKLEHNVWIAGALNYAPVSRIFIVVKAEPRIDCVIDSIRKYADCFLELPMDVVGVLITHMDLVEWKEEDATSAVQEDLGINSIVFSSKSTTGRMLLVNILKTCSEKYNLTVNGENFLKLFKIHNHHRKILKCTSDEIERFKDIKKAFDDQRKAHEHKDQVDLIFEFQAFMKTEIVKAQRRLSEANNFTFFGENRANEAGHVANLANQLRAILYNIRMECLKYQSDQSVSQLRRCPHCNKVWAKVEGCDGETTCGKRPSLKNDLRDANYAVFGTYSFCWLAPNLDIVKSGEKKARLYDDIVSSNGHDKMTTGCGKRIIWKQMPPAEVPHEFKETTQISTGDIDVLPLEASDFQEDLSKMISSAERCMKLSLSR